MTGAKHKPLPQRAWVNLQLPMISEATNSHSSKCHWLMKSHNPLVSCPGYNGRHIFSTLDAPRLTPVSKIGSVDLSAQLDGFRVFSVARIVLV